MHKSRFLILTMISALMLSNCSAKTPDTPQTGADTEEEGFELPPIPDDLTGVKPWIDSVVEGNVTAQTKTSPTDDFYTWVNKDWMVSSHIPEGSTTLDFDMFAQNKQNVLKALEGEKAYRS